MNKLVGRLGSIIHFLFSLNLGFRVGMVLRAFTISCLYPGIIKRLPTPIFPVLFPSSFPFFTLKGSA